METTNYFGELTKLIIRFFTLLLYGTLSLAGITLKLISEMMKENSRSKS